MRMSETNDKCGDEAKIQPFSREPSRSSRPAHLEEEVDAKESTQHGCADLQIWQATILHRLDPCFENSENSAVQELFMQISLRHYLNNPHTVLSSLSILMCSIQLPRLSKTSIIDRQKVLRMGHAQCVHKWL